MKVAFLGTPDFVKPIKKALAANFTLTNQIKGSDLLVVASYGKILSKNLINTPKYGSINVHPSLLPKYRGPSPMQQAILSGDEISGITIIKMDEKVDHGSIIYAEEFRLSNKDTFESLSKKMFQRSAEILPKIIKDFVSGKIKPEVQSIAAATYCPLIKKQDGYFDINNPPSPEKLDRMIRAYYPWPTAWTKWSFDSAQDHRRGKIVKFLPARNASHSDAGGPNQMMQMEGKKVIPLKDFLNGYPDFPIRDFLSTFER